MFLVECRAADARILRIHDKLQAHPLTLEPAYYFKESDGHVGEFLASKAQFPRGLPNQGTLYFVRPEHEVFAKLALREKADYEAWVHPSPRIEIDRHPSNAAFEFSVLHCGDFHEIVVPRCPKNAAEFDPLYEKYDSDSREVSNLLIASREGQAPVLGQYTLQELLRYHSQHEDARYEYIRVKVPLTPSYMPVQEFLLANKFTVCGYWPKRFSSHHPATLIYGRFLGNTLRDLWLPDDLDPLEKFVYHNVASDYSRHMRMKPPHD
eukprot:TRINITY_DN5079_c1_g1_i1.p1 TRINITY_DN5079_c1_g1~~TRINITY_DN5079_c1_g1_i1.p1  ORF type:complete len:265 (-),score=39.07 TRINITY_DN5079_c1_g1_i1:582-1376(-)